MTSLAATGYTAAITLYANWTAINYNLTYHLGGGALPTGKTNPTAYTVETATFTLNNPVKTGYTFAGWTGTDLTAATSSVCVTKGSTGAKTFTATWTANTYTVAYNGNKPTAASGTVTGVPANQNCTYDANYTLGTAPSLTGYTFGGWYKETGCTNKVGDAGASVKNTAAIGTVTLYAKWTANTYTVAYNGNKPTAATGSVTGVPANQNCTYDAIYTLGAAPSLTGYTFGGWYKEAACTNKVGNAGAPVKNTAATGTVTLYAKWTANSYAVAYNGNKPAAATGSVTGVPANQNCTYDANYTLGAAPSLTGYTFGGWYKEAACTNKVGDAGASVKNTATTGTVTLYAKWTVITYPVDFGSGAPPDGTVVEINGTTYTVVNGTIELPSTDSDILTVVSTNGQSDPHAEYPTDLKVYKLTYDPNTGRYTMTHLSALDGILQYSGMSIRIAGRRGIRMITSVPESMRALLMGGGVDGYTLEEYGTLVAWKKDLGSNPLILGQSYSKANYAYKKGVSDPIFARENGMIQYTNVLVGSNPTVGFTDDQCKEELVLRPYAILEKNGERVTIYGGQVQRSIGFIAYQNRNAFAPGTAAYEYIWSMIHAAYGTQYDSEYRQ